MSVTIHSEADIQGMRVAGRLAAEVLDFIMPYVKPGISTGELDSLCHDYMVRVQNTVPAPLNYAPPGHSPFPKSVCTSVNDVICHGIPGGRMLKSGDIINIDVTVIKDGYYGDNSRMFHVGKPSAAARRLCQVAYECMWSGIVQVKPGGYVGDIGHAIHQHATRLGVSVVPEIYGHGIGKTFHEEPWIPSCGTPGTLERLMPGMTFTVEPIVTAGSAAWEKLADGWTLVTRDHSLSAQWEHTVLVTGTGYEVLTVSAGTPAVPRDVLMRGSNVQALVVEQA